MTQPDHAVADSTHLSADSASVEARNLGVQYPDGTVALEDISLKVYPNETVTVIGPSGCGKSTLLMCAAGFQRPTKGEILRDGVAIRKPRADCPVVFQDLNQLFAWKTILGNLTYAISVTGHAKGAAARERASSYLDMVGIRRAERQYPHHLSGGMKQRAAIARALAINPALLLMDEPFGALDAITRAELQLELKRITREQGLTVLFITHSVEEALFLGDRVVVMSSQPGRIAGVVNTSEIDSFDHPNMAARVPELRSLLVPAEASSRDLQSVSPPTRSKNREW